MSMTTMSAEHTHPIEDPFELFLAASEAAIEALVPYEIIGKINDNESFTDAQKARRLYEAIEYQKGSAAARLWQELPVEPAPDLTEVYFWTDIEPSIETDTDGSQKPTEKAQRSDRLYNLRNSIGRKLTDHDIAPGVADDAKVVASEFGGNIVRQCPINGGWAWCGRDALRRIVIVVEGDANPAGITYTGEETFVDDAEHGRGIQLSCALGECRKFPIDHDADGTPTSWQISCAIPTPESIALAASLAA